ncbi:MAG TPA: antibiotic biosynthesis monooxygenase, partial [Candidatus Caenarcaniphilales bacterium]|nr:antibiotic biosynthesis monooxygenase [Candidatus Caenarcaniphilales bacterium]
AVVLRVIRFLVEEQSEPAFMQHLRRLVDESIGSAEGLIESRLARRLERGRVVVLSTSVWQDYASLASFLGNEVSRPFPDEPYRGLFESATVEHFEDVSTATLSVG